MGGRGSSSQTAASMGMSAGGVAFAKADSSTQALHAQRIKALESDAYGPGTYDLDTLELVEYTSGYQVTFYQIGDDYTPDEYAEKVNEFLAASSDGVVSAGKFEGTPEVSFNVGDRDTAIALAKKYNQISVWDNGAFDDEAANIETGGTGRR